LDNELASALYNFRGYTTYSISTGCFSASAVARDSPVGFPVSPFQWTLSQNTKREHCPDINFIRNPKQNCANYHPTRQEPGTCQRPAPSQDTRTIYNKAGFNEMSKQHHTNTIQYIIDVLSDSPTLNANKEADNEEHGSCEEYTESGKRTTKPVYEQEKIVPEFDSNHSHGHISRVRVHIANRGHEFILLCCLYEDESTTSGVR
jgi:hypothetical protein